MYLLFAIHNNYLLTLGAQSEILRPNFFFVKSKRTLQVKHLKQLKHNFKVYPVSFISVENRSRQWKVHLCFLKDKNIQSFISSTVWHYLSALKRTRNQWVWLVLFHRSVLQRYDKILERHLKLFMFPIYILRGAICKQRETYEWKVVIFHDPLYASTECGMAAITSL